MLGSKTPDKAAGPKLRIFPAALEGYRFTFRNAGTALRLILVSTLCIAGIHFALVGFEPVEDEVRQALAELAEILAQLLLATMVLVAWQRRILLGPGNAKMRFGRREGRMLVAVLALSLMVALAAVIALLLAVGLEIAGMDALLGKLDLLANFVSAYLIGRFYFVLPARAMDRKLTFREAWRMTGGHGKSLMFVVVLVGIPVALLTKVVLGAQAVALENGASGMIVATVLLDNFLFLLDIVVTSAAMTFCYAALGGYQHILEARRAEAEATELAAAPT